MSILKDRIRPLDPSSLQEFLEAEPVAEADVESSDSSSEPERLTEDLRPHVPMGQTEFELASRGGYIRTVTGTVAYLDEEAQTYMVSRGNGDGELLRVPLRDITSAHETAAGVLQSQEIQGLGTGR